MFSPLRGEGGGNPDELIDYINGFVRGVEFPATYIHKILDYRISLECDIEHKAEWLRLTLLNRRTPEFRRERAKIVVNDAACGLLMGSDAGNQPHSQTQRVEDFKKIVRASRSIVYCLPVDETDLDLTASFKQFDVINQLRNSEKIGLERLVLCLTKYEALWKDRDTDAFDEACDLDTFKEHAKRIIQNMRVPLVALSSQSQISEMASRIEVCVAPVSAFGFVRDNGCVNFNQFTKRLLVESGDPRSARRRKRGGGAKLNPRSSIRSSLLQRRRGHPLLAAVFLSLTRSFTRPLD